MSRRLTFTGEIPAAQNNRHSNWKLAANRPASHTTPPSKAASPASTTRLAVALLALVLAFGLVAITFNTIRLQIVTQRAEIEISKLVGATDAFIRRPFYYLGALQGLAGGALALLLVWGGLAALNRGVAQLAASYGSSFRLEFLGAGDAAAVLAFAAALGWFGAWLSVSKYLLEIE